MLGYWIQKEKLLSEKKSLLIGCFIGVFILSCVACMALGAVSVFFVTQVVENGISFGDLEYSENILTPTPNLVRPEDDGDQSLEDQIVGSQSRLSEETLAALEDALVPENDPRGLAERLMGIQNIPETVLDSNAPYEVGDSKTFWVMDTDTNISSEKETTLRSVTPHAYIWIGDEVVYDEDELYSLAEEFENNIYPTNREFFGTEWSPGVDGDIHIYIVYVGGLGGNVAGYFSPGDEVHPLASEYSNGHELFMFNADNSPLNSDYTRGVLAHEFQHMIHWYRDRNETSWLNEGFAEVSVLLNGFDVGGVDAYFMQNPDDQLNDWPNDGNTTANYGSSFIFLTYFLDRMGEEVTKEVIAHPVNGLKSIDLVLENMNITDPLTGAPIDADDLVLDWALTNYIHDDRVLDGRFVYNNYSYAPQAFETETLRDCSGSVGLRDVEQYGTDYIRITCDGSHNLNFIGSISTEVLPENPHSGNYAFWSNKGDESDMTLTKSFDFTGHEGPISFNYWLWYDLEIDYDYIYLLASANGGEWEFLTTPSGSDYDPSGNSYGWGFNGVTDGWIEESIDLSRFAGQEVRLRFEYVTDAAVHGEGLLLDDVSIPEIGYFEGFENDEGGWEAAGFARISNKLPQTYNLALISYGDETTVEYLTLAKDNTSIISFEIGDGVDEVVLVVQGTTRFTRQKAAYKLEFLP